MKQIFEWLREQIAVALNEPPYYHNGEDFYTGIVHAESLINEAEAKWEQDCCEWKEQTWNMYNAHERFTGESILKEWKCCPYCGKRIKIVGVE